jgi:VWFA-related protein
MRRFPARVLIASLLSVAAAGGQQSSSGNKNSVPSQGTGTPLAVVDVVVQDQNGRPVHGLSKNSFQLMEGTAPQQIRGFEEHTSAAPQVRWPEVPKFPPGTFTDYSPVPSDGTLNILLLDTLNTPVKDQSFIRNQLQQFVKAADPGAHIAIFGLTTRLIFLQGFTSDPETLRDAVAHKLIPRSSVLLEDSDGSKADIQSHPETANETVPTMAQIAANLQLLEFEQKTPELQLRQQYTLNAFHQLAHYLANFPGRKNLIWVSDEFPLNLLPAPGTRNPVVSMDIDKDEFRETADLLTRARVAVYPVDARGLMTASAADSTSTGQTNAGDTATPNNSQTAEHGTIEQLADSTGGHAWFHANGLSDAVTRAVDSGSSYYTLIYSPSDTKQQGEYREVRVNLTGALTARGLQIAYRHGYYADDPKQPHPTTEAAAATHSAETYAAAVMARGTPAPADILFKVRVLPDSTADEETLAPGNQSDPSGRTKGPFRRFDVDFAALPDDFHLTQQADGLRTGMIEFIACVYDRDGRLWNTMGNSVHLNLKPETYQQFLQQGMSFHLQVSVPARRESYLRIAIHDVPSNRFGVVEIPASAVGHLEPQGAPKPAPSPSAPH